MYDQSGDVFTTNTRPANDTQKTNEMDRENRRAGSDNAADIRDVPGRAAHIPARGCTPSHADENKITGEFGHNVHET